MDKELLDLNQLDYYTHPPLIARQTSLIHVVSKYISIHSEFNLKDEDINPLLSMAFVDAEICYLKLTGKEISSPHRSETMQKGQPTKDHLDKIYLIANDLEPKLAKICWGEPGVQLR